ncbi:hypothetical protein M1V18_004376 [Salmonella enterica]|nr:hypothetical protein [Salmonella enterica]
MQKHKNDVIRIEDLEEVKARTADLQSGQGEVIIESWMPADMVGRYILSALTRAAGAPIKVSYFDAPNGGDE